MLHTVPKKTIVVGADHADQGYKRRNAIVGFLESQGRTVVVLDHGSKEDSYAEIAVEACWKIILGRRKLDGPTCAVLIDQLGGAMASVANSFPKINAFAASGPKTAYELTRKNNPIVLCVPVQIERNNKFIDVTPSDAVKIVEQWLCTEFLQDFPENKHKKYKMRQKQNDEIHLQVVKHEIAQARLFGSLAWR